MKFDSLTQKYFKKTAHMAKKIKPGQNDIPEEINLSRTQKKKAAVAAQKDGEALVALTDAQLREMELPDELYEAVMDARNMRSHGAMRRQLQYIGSIMRIVDAASINEKLAALSQQSVQEVRKFKQVEQWRDELKAGNSERVDWLLTQFPAMDRVELLKLSNEARIGSSEAGKRKAGKALFRYLRKFVN